MSSSSNRINYVRSYRDAGVIVPAGALVATGIAASLAITAVCAFAALSYRAQAQNARLALRLSVEREAAFVESARRLSDASRVSVTAVREEMERAIREIAPGVDAVLFFEEIDALLVCVAASGVRVPYYRGIRCALDDEASLLVRALRSGHRITTRDAPDTRPLHPGDAFAAAIPLVLDAGRRCVLYVGADESDYAVLVDRIVRLVDQATPAYGIALERADDRARAEYDGLTGLLTARAFRTRFAALTERTRYVPMGRLALLFIDTDRFKSWNDTYGHASGDALLRELARLLQASATDVADLVARNGGDEFCVVLADCEKSSAIDRAERLRASVAAADFRSLQPAGAHADVRISASIGVASFPVDAATPSALLEKADEAMYHSKKTGRDAVSYFSVDGMLVRAQSAHAANPDPERRRA